MKLLKGFLKDQLLNFIGYLGITALILLYCYLKAGKVIGIIYPLLLALFVILSVTLIKGLHYLRFHKALQTGDFNDFLITGAYSQEKEVIEAIHNLHHRYQKEIGQLLQQKEEADAFTAQMAHDLKIPVSLIRLVIDDIENTEAPRIISSENIDKIRTGCDRLTGKLSQLLSVLRLGRFEKDYLIERVNLIDEIRNAVNEKKDYFIRNHIYPQFDAGQAPVYILTDRKWHGMLLDQIISNAIKYSAIKGTEGYVRFEVICQREFIELTVTDHGIGIPSYDMERIFDPFFTGENGRQTGNSSGIGLYLCRRICDKLGHRITVTSVRGEKTEVTIRYLSKL